MKQQTKGKLIQSDKALELMEGIGVVMRIAAFGMLSIMGKDTPFLWMWVWNTIDAVILTYCVWERDNKPYIIMNMFWLLVGAIGIYNSI
jgi:hypothetical protein